MTKIFCPGQNFLVLDKNFLSMDEIFLSLNKIILSMQMDEALDRVPVPSNEFHDVQCQRHITGRAAWLNGTRHCGALLSDPVGKSKPTLFVYQLLPQDSMTFLGLIWNIIFFS